MDQREKDRLLWNLRSTPNEVADLVCDLDSETLRWKPFPEKWSILEVLCHLSDIETEVLQKRCREILANENPFLPEVRQDELAEAGHYGEQNPASVLLDFERRRAETVELLEAIPANDWLRSGVHFSAGPTTIQDVVIRMSGHDVRHLIQMKDIARVKMPW